MKAGVSSTAILFGSWTRPILTGFGILFATTLGYAGISNKQNFAFFTLSVGGTFTHLMRQYVTVDLDDPGSCRSETSLPRHFVSLKNHLHRCFCGKQPAGVDYHGRPPA
jgi:hypothetical protein